MHPQFNRWVCTQIQTHTGFVRSANACRHSILPSLAACAVWALCLPAMAADNSSASAAALKVLLGPSLPIQQMGNAPPTAVPTSAAQVHSSSGHVLASTPRATVTVQRGETLDRLIRRALPAMPLHPDLLRKAFVNANPQVFPRGAAHAMRSGTSLQVPSTDDLRQLLVTQHPEFVAIFNRPDAAATAENEAVDKRRWVRYP